MKKTKYTAVGKPKNHLKKWWGLTFIVSILTIVALLEISGTTHLFHKKHAVSTIPSTAPDQNAPAPSQTTSEPSQTTPAPEQNTQKSSGGGATTSNSTTSSVALSAPYGSFVSNHYPGKDGSPTSEESVCITTAGATCYIQFVNGSVTKKLDDHKTDSNGSTVWNWDIKSAGLTKGSWQITAVASSNGETKTTVDPIKLEVQ